MNRVTEVFDRTFTPSQDNRRSIVWRESPKLRVYSDQIEGFPHFVDQLINVEPFLGRNWNRHWNFIPDDGDERIDIQEKDQLTEDQVPRSKWHRSNA